MWNLFLEIIIAIKPSSYSHDLTTNHVKTLLGTNLSYFLPSSHPRFAFYPLSNSFIIDIFIFMLTWFGIYHNNHPFTNYNLYNLILETKLDYYIHKTKHTSNKTTLYKTIMKFLININTYLVPKSATYDLISSFNSLILSFMYTNANRNSHNHISQG